MTRLYEMISLIRADLPEEKKNSVINSLSEAIEKIKGEIISKDFWQEKRTLAYPIKKEKEACYYLVNFKAEPDSISKLRQIYRLNEDILRFLIIKKE